MVLPDHHHLWDLRPVLGVYHLSLIHISSVLSVVLCFAMLVGSTFAWFTDSASTGVNKIVAGNLAIDLVDESGNSLEGKTLGWVAYDGREQEAILWEPGCTYNMEPFYICLLYTSRCV